MHKVQVSDRGLVACLWMCRGEGVCETNARVENLDASTGPLLACTGSPEVMHRVVHWVSGCHGRRDCLMRFVSSASWL